MVAVRANGSTARRRLTQGAVFRRVGSAATVVALLAAPVLAASPAQAFSSQQWALNYLKASQDWQVSKGSGVTVAVLDSGVASIPDLNGQVASGADFSTSTTSSGNGRTDTDSGGHGTGMASLISGNGTAVTGLAPSSKMLAVRVMTGAGGFTTQELAAGIQYAVQHHAGVINLSVGGSDSDPVVQQAISAAIAANVVIVASSGNESNTSVDYPAAYPGVVAVGAIDQNGQIWGQSNTGAQVALAAPGVSIYRDNNLNQQGTESGTSEATAYVSAAAALIRSAHPDWTAGQVIRDLIGTADPASGQSAGQHSDQYGYGIIDPLKALHAAAPSDKSNPLLSSSNSSAGASPSTGSTPGGGTSTTPSSNAAAPASSSSSHTGLIIAIIVGAIVIIGLILLIVALGRRGRGGPKPPGGNGPGGGSGYQPPPYPQQNPYQQGGYPPQGRGQGQGQQPPQYPSAPQYPQNPNPYGQQQPPQYPQG
ncbi:MAG: S8 family serine peptidase [Actinocrinis sp.]